MIDTTLPKPGEHVPLPGQLSLLEEDADPRAERSAVLVHWHGVLAGRPDAVPPRIESLSQFAELCDQGPQAPFWQCVRRAAEAELGRLWPRKLDWAQTAAEGTAYGAVIDEVNLMLARVCGPDELRAAKESIMPAAVARKTKPEPKAPKAKRQPSKTKDVDASSLSKPTLADELVRLPLDRLVPSPYQTRKPPTQERLVELGNLLTQEGQMTPCLVRIAPNPDYWEIIGGHTRSAAAKMIGWQMIQCRLVECDDAAAQRLVLIDNASHAGLTIIEHAQAVAELVDNYAAAGKSQRQLAVDIGVPQSEISNLVRMLALPEVWQQRVITEEITKTQARELLPWVDVPDLWPVMETARANDDGLTFDELLHESLLDVSRPMAGSWYDETRSRWSVVAFKATADERKALTCRKVNGVERAFAWQLWESMQHVAEDKAAKKAAKQVEATAGKVAAKKITPKQAAEQFNKRLYRWKVAWLQQRIAAALEDKTEADTLVLLLVWFAQDGHTASHERRTSLAKAFGVRRTSWHQTDAIHILQAVAAKPAAERTASLRRILQEWVQHPADTGSTDMPAPLVDWLAEHLGIDIVRQWSTDRSYLELLTTAQLQELAAEWKVRSTDTKRGDLIEWLAEAGKEKPCPKAVQGIKAVSLT